MKALLVIGIHREELAFGEAVAAGLARGDLDVLRIPDGLSGRRPRPDQCFQYDLLHRALYAQLLPYVLGHYDVMLDLHTGLDRHGPSADLIGSQLGRFSDLRRRIAREWPDTVRLVALGRHGEVGFPVAETVIPELLWRNPSFLYVGIEVFLPELGPGSEPQQAFARELIGALLDSLPI